MNKVLDGLYIGDYMASINKDLLMKNVRIISVALENHTYIDCSGLFGAEVSDGNVPRKIIGN